MSAFDDIKAIGPLRVWNDVVAREVHGEQSTLAVVELEPARSSRSTTTVPHEVRAGSEGAVVIDVFAPARADWGGLEREDARSPHWP